MADPAGSGGVGGQPVAAGGATGVAGAGGTAGADLGGATGSAGQGGTVGSADPTTDEGAACNQCTLDNCVADTDGCSPQLLETEAKRQTCLALFSCIRAGRCVTAGDATACFCGPAAGANSGCFTVAGTASGPCVKEYQAAAETTDPALILQRFVDPRFAIGGADNLISCRSNYCSAGGDVPNAVCALSSNR